MTDINEPIKPILKEGVCIINNLIPIAVIKTTNYNKHEILVYINEKNINVELFYELLYSKDFSIETVGLLGLKYAAQELERRKIESLEDLFRILFNNILNAFLVTKGINYVKNVFDKGISQVAPYRLIIYKVKHNNLLEKDDIFKTCHNAFPFKLTIDEFNDLEKGFIETNKQLLSTNNMFVLAVQMLGLKPQKLTNSEDFLIREASMIPRLVDILNQLEIRYF